MTDTVSPPEDRLFRRFRRRGDPEALAAVFDATAPDLLRLAHLLVGADAAEDLVQATFVDAIEHCERHDETRRVRPWLCGLLAMHARRLRRARAAEAKALRSAAPGRRTEMPPADRRAEAGEVAANLEQAIDELGEPYASVAHLHLREGLNAREIAERTGRPPGTVRTQIVRALQRLRRELPSLAPGVVVMASAGPDLVALQGLRDRVLAHAGGRAGVSGSSAAAGAGLTAVGVVMVKKLACGLGALAVVGLAVGWWMLPPRLDPAPVGPSGRRAASEVVAGPGVEPGAGGTGAATARRRAVVEARPRSEPERVVLLVRRDSGEPVAGRSVNLRAEDRVVATGVTDETGRWTLEELPEAGVLQLAAWRTRVEELPEEQGMRIWTVGGGRAVRGRVVDGQEQPVGGAEVHVDRLYGRSRDLLDPVAVTDLDGTFAFEVMDADECVLCVRAAGYETVGSPRLDVPAEDVVLRLPHRGRRLQGVALDPEGQPVPHARLTVTMLCNESRRTGDRSGRAFEAVFDTDAAGRFDVRWLPAGSGVVVHCDAPLRSVLARTSLRWIGRAAFDLREAAAANVTVRGAAVARLSVRFLDAGGTAVEDADVSACDAHEGTLFAGGVPLRVTARTDAEGRALLEGLPATRVQVGASLGRLTASQELDLAAGETRNLTLRAGHAQRSLVVQLVDPEGDPLAGWEWRVRARLGSRLTNVRTDAKGFARLRGLDGPGPYRVEVLNRAGTVGTFEGLVARTEPHRLVIETGVGEPGSIEGRLELPAGAADPLGQVEGQLTVVPAGGGSQLRAQLRGRRFRIDSLPPGRYRCAFQSKAWWVEPTVIDVPAGEVVDAGVLRLQPAVRFRVSCPSLTAAEAGAARVLLGQPGSSAPLAGLAEQDADRANVWDLAMGLGPASYRIVVVAPGYVPAMRDLDAVGGVNLVEFPALERGVPVRLRITCPEPRGPFGAVARGSVLIRDESGATVLDERFFGHYDDIDERLVVRELGLAPGRYTLSARAAGRSAERGFTVPAGVAEHTVGLAIE